MKKSIKINGDHAYCKTRIDNAELFLHVKIWDNGGTFTFEHTIVVIGDKAYWRKSTVEKWRECDAVKYFLSGIYSCERFIEATAENVELNAKLEDINNRGDMEIVSALDEKLGVVYDDDEEEDGEATNVGVKGKITSE